MSTNLDLSEYFNSPNLSSDEVFAQEDRLAAVLEEAAGGCTHLLGLLVPCGRLLILVSMSHSLTLSSPRLLRSTLELF